MAAWVLVVALCLGAVAACVPAAHGAGPGAVDRPAAGGRTVLVELFTSQGCSSCPAADAFVRELPRLGFDRAKVVPLTFHVDYWDDLGWKDPFAAPGFTERQRRYVERGRLRSPEGEDGLQGLYTPQMIVDGAVHFSGRRRDVALKEIQKAAGAPAAIDLDGVAAVQGDQATVSVRLSPRGPEAFRQPLQLLVALAARSARTAVTRGENSGETLEEAAVVRALSAPARVIAAPAGPIAVSLDKPAALSWSAVEIDAILSLEATGRVVAVRSIALPAP
ncbi:MAG TPA: DUF1223 domain-containing protein [Polyangia bacterium]|jgi:hypothetical protein